MLLSLALESEGNEMVKRLKYTKEILSQMLQPSSTENGKQNNNPASRERERPEGKQKTIIEINKLDHQPLQDGMSKLNTVCDS